MRTKKPTLKYNVCPRVRSFVNQTQEWYREYNWAYSSRDIVEDRGFEEIVIDELKYNEPYVRENGIGGRPLVFFELDILRSVVAEVEKEESVSSLNIMLKYRWNNPDTVSDADERQVNRVFEIYFIAVMDFVYTFETLFRYFRYEDNLTVNIVKQTEQSYKKVICLLSDVSGNDQEMKRRDLIAKLDPLDELMLLFLYNLGVSNFAVSDQGIIGGEQYQKDSLLVVPITDPSIVGGPREVFHNEDFHPSETVFMSLIVNCLTFREIMVLRGVSKSFRMICTVNRRGKENTLGLVSCDPFNDRMSPSKSFAIRTGEGANNFSAFYYRNNYFYVKSPDSVYKKYLDERGFDFYIIKLVIGPRMINLFRRINTRAKMTGDQLKSVLSLEIEDDKDFKAKFVRAVHLIKNFEFISKCTKFKVNCNIPICDFISNELNICRVKIKEEMKSFGPGDG